MYLIQELKKLMNKFLFSTIYHQSKPADVLVFVSYSPFEGLDNYIQNLKNELSNKTITPSSIVTFARFHEPHENVKFISFSFDGNVPQQSLNLKSLGFNYIQFKI